MNFSQEQLEQTTEMGSLFFSPEQVSLNLELPDQEAELFASSVFLKNTAHPLVAAYLQGWLTTDIALRKAIRQSAMNGSSPSQQLLLSYQKDAQ